MNHLKRWLTVLVVAGPLLVAGNGCGTDKKQPKVEGSENKPELKPLPPPGGPGGGKKAGAGNAVQ
jgi:hypothetical protein